MVPAIAWLLHRLADAALGPLPDQILWLVYEIAFAVLAVWWATQLIPGERPVAERFLRATAWYVATYYALWALADVLILAGLDAGWALRVVPNQLYYGFWVPVVWWLVLRAAVRGDQQRRSRRADSAGRARASAARGSPTTPSGALARRSG